MNIKDIIIEEVHELQTDAILNEVKKEVEKLLFDTYDDSSPTMAGFGERLRSISEERKIGININDDTQPFSQQILNGEKTIETRNSPTLRPYVGKRVGIVSTGKNRKAMLVGFVNIDDEFVYNDLESFDADVDKHLVRPDSPFYMKDIKYGYHLSNPEKIKPIPVESKGMVSRKIDEDYRNGCDFFDIKTTGMPYYDNIMKGNDNSMSHILIYMTKDEYFKFAETSTGGMVTTKIDKIMTNMKNGVKYHVPMIDISPETHRLLGDFQEGRHRVVAATNLGCKKIPVEIFGEESQLYALSKEVNKKYKQDINALQDEINSNEKYADLRNFNINSIEDLKTIKYRFEDKLQDVKNNRDYDYFNNYIKLLNELINKYS